MIVSDTDFLSSFSKINKLDLVFKIFKIKEIVIAHAVYNELKESPVFDLLLPYFSAKENKIKVEASATNDVPENLGKGERESISLAKDKKAKLLMDDRDAGEYAESKGIDVIDIPAFLFHCKEKKVLSISEITSIINDLKDKDHYEFEARVKEELQKTAPSIQESSRNDVPKETKIELLFHRTKSTRSIPSKALSPVRKNRLFPIA